MDSFYHNWVNIAQYWCFFFLSQNCNFISHNSAYLTNLSLYHAILHLCLAFLSLYLTILQLKSEKKVELRCPYLYLFGEQLCNNKKIIIHLWRILLYPLFTCFKRFRLNQLLVLVSSVGYTKFPCEHQRFQSDLSVCRASFGICYNTSTERLITEREGLFCTGSLTLLAVFITFHFNEP